MLRALLTFCILSSTAFAADQWPSWRGPTENGVAAADAKPPLTWDETKNIKWKVPLPGYGSATPIVWGERIFVVTAEKTDRVAKPDELPKAAENLEQKTERPKHFYRFLVMCFNRTTGKPIWSKVAAERVPHQGHHETNSYAASSPTTDGKRLYVSFGSFGIYAYDLDGNLIWNRDLGAMQTRLGWGEAVTPALHGNSLVLNWDQETNAKVITLNATTGDTIWEAKRDEKTTWSTPKIVEHAGKTQVIMNGTRIRSYNLADGKILWETGGMTSNPIPMPLVDQGVAYVMSGYPGNAAVAVPLDSIGDVPDSKVIWRYGKGTPYVPSPVLVDGRLYFTSKNSEMLTILEAKTGKPLLEAERLPNLKQIYSSPIAAAGRLYFVDRSGTTLVMKASDKVEVLATNKLNDAIDASPVAVGKTLYLRSNKFLYAIEE
ncbi:MAG: PQQ-binding-like beta-propeller repeat protein [Fimbriiglobus sp.]